MVFWATPERHDEEKNCKREHIMIKADLFLAPGPYWYEGWVTLVVTVILAISCLIKLPAIAKRVDLIDHPVGRKAHEREIPLIGGIAIFVAFTFGILLAPFGWTDQRFLFIASGMIVLMGILDDYQEIGPITKMALQILIAFLLVEVGDLIVPSVGDIFAWDDGNEQGLGWMAAPLTIIAIISVINAYNMIDGHDGLAAGMFLLTSGIIILFCNTVGYWKLQFLLVAMFVPTAVFFLFNCGFLGLKRFKSFLGDAGSMFLGLMLAYSLIMATNEYEHSIRRVLVPWLLGVPMFDMVAVFFERIAIKRSPVVADRSHIHHLLLKMGVTKHAVLGTLLVFQLLFCLVAVLGGVFGTPDWLLFWTIFPTLAIYITFRGFLQRRLREVTRS